MYALRDPRDEHVFYVGKGNGDRVFNHLNEADIVKNANAQGNCSAKLQRIIDIWNANRDVEWWIVRHGLQAGADPPVDALDIEAALIDVLSLSPNNGRPLNEIDGHDRARGILSAEDVADLAAPMVNPGNSGYAAVFVFPIQDALDEGRSVYEATRRSWVVSEEYRNLPQPLAVGIAHGISKGVFQINGWQLAVPPLRNTREFNGNDVTRDRTANELHPLASKNWRRITSATGYWQRGNYVIVGFDGEGRFRFIRGSANREWQQL